MASGEPNKASPAATYPPYPEMIIAAISALNEKNGSNKAEISKYMESSYTDLPSDHSTLLSHHLNTLKENGELVMAENSYMLPNSNSDSVVFQRRGRGRPPKLKPDGPVATVVGPPRPRGRPPKSKGSAAASVRPSKKSRPAGGTGRPRGRPPKAKPQWPIGGME